MENNDLKRKRGAGAMDGVFETRFNKKTSNAL